MQLEKVMWVIESSIILQIIPSYILHALLRGEVYLTADARVHRRIVLRRLCNMKSFKFLSIFNSLKGTWYHSFHLEVLWGYFIVFIIQKELWLLLKKLFASAFQSNSTFITLDILHLYTSHHSHESHYHSTLIMFLNLV